MVIEPKIQELHNYVIQGLINGLTHTHRDSRRDDIVWVRKRGQLFEAFARCVFAIHNNQNYETDEKELKEIANEGYKFNTHHGVI